MSITNLWIFPLAAASRGEFFSFFCKSLYFFTGILYNEKEKQPQTHLRTTYNKEIPI